MKLFQRAQNSLFGEILDSLLAPALLVVLMSIGVTWLVARGIANAPYDRSLTHNVRALADEAVRAHAQGSTLRVTPLLLAALRGDASDHIWLQVLDEDGRRLAGDAQMPAPQWSDTPQPDVVYLSDAQINGMAVRIAQLRVRVDATPTAPGTAGMVSDGKSSLRFGPDGLALDSSNWQDWAAPRPTSDHTLLVQLAETRIKQAGHAAELITGVLLPQFALLPLAVMLLWIALARGIKPLSAVEERLRERRPDDLSPIDESTVPLEVAPLVSALNVLLGKLSDSMATQKRFLADAAHQLKTPLAGLRMQADLALREAADAQALKQSLKQIGRSSVRATHTVNQLLALARAEGGIGTLSRHPCDLARLTMELVREMLPRAMDKSLDLGYEGAQPGSPGVLLEGNAALLRELIHNLLDNAINYTPSSTAAPGVITARVLADPFGHVLLLQVEDSGAGIPEAERELVFEPFYRVLGNEADGSGLGLPIVREIAHQHRAQVLLEDARPGQQPPGTRFTVRFDTSDGAPQP
ncbi:sensor histidine kinase N-terminal domain-containing protein [Xenophilus arseniciresistens]|uniref:histidine kinase n=1 Tax=Xenophilus arseniciresistens TaxID=1283306 RepID=A0AAE3NBL9_9BURK|nr:sensor histidine kinase [Xenophilus arseniciresistens]MDA7418563.1 sensor histidine kinase N-terminal domain-containing protein [Xenophilus arseniciresistens]